MSNSTGNSHGSNAGGGGGGGGGGSGSNFGAIGFGTFSIGASHGGSMVSVGSNANSHGGTSSNEMASHSFESRIDKMRRFISSPLTRRKSTSQASTETAPPLSSTSSAKNLESHHSNKIFGTPIEKLTHQRSFNEMSSSSICSSSTHLSASSYCTMRSMSTSGLPGNPFSSPSSSSPLSSSTINMGDSMVFGQTSLLSSSRKVDSEQTVPFVITRLCHYIEDSQGLMQEGLFRTSGNARLIEKLKTSFDSNGDAPLETEGDIPSAAALLKLFLRELPVPLIPQSIHCLFLDTVQDTLNQGSLYNKDAFIGRLKMLVENLPDENYFLLKYLSRFLHQVARHETYNRMNPSSLGIIFGPNIFRVAAEDYKGLREQSLTNQVVTFFITDYEAIFGKDSPDNEESINLLTHQDQDSLDIDQSTQLTLEETRKLEGNTKDKVIIVSIESDDLHQMTGKHQGESSFCSLSSSSSPSNKTIMAEDDVNNLDNVSAKAAEISLSGDDHYTALQIDIPPIDCEPSDSSSISPNTFACSSISPCAVDSKEYLLSIDSSASTATLPTITPKKSQHQSSECFKRKDRKSVLSSSSPVMRSSSEERKPFAFPDQMESNQANQDVRRCNSYQDISKDGDKESSFISDQQQQTFKSNNLSSDSVTQSPRPKRRETESVKARLSRSTLSFECRPTSLDLSGRSNSVESKSEPMIRNKSSHVYTEDSSKPLPLNEQQVDENESKYIPLTFCKSYSKGSQQTNNETSHPNVENRPISSCQSSQQSEPDLSRAPSSSSKIPLTSSCSSSLPHIDLNTLHKNAEGESAMVSDLRYSWSSANESLSAESLLEAGDDNADDADDDDTSETQSDPRLLEAKSNEPVQNAAIQILRRRNTYEAPLSPSAYRGFLGQRAPHLDHTIPPSPPGEQEHHFHGHKASYNHESQAVKEAKRKIHNLKRRLKQFEKDFEKETGYRPSHEQKMKSDVAQPILFELNKFRKILRECKEDARLTLEFYEGVFNEMQRSLKERRCVVGRPETIEEMSIDQIFEEKLDLQKSLLKYESVFGRPCRREDRTVMKPLYDRYRTIRNLVAKIPKNKEITDLQPILEHVAMNFSSPSHSPGSSLDVKDDSDEDINNNNKKKLDRSRRERKGEVKGKKKDDGSEDDDEDEEEEEEEEGYDQENSNNNANLNSNNVNSDDNNNQVVVDNNNPSKFELTDSITRTQPRPEATHAIKVKESSLSRYTKVSTLAGEKLTVPISSHKLVHNLHELPPNELAKELAVVRREKNELRKIIRSFEDEFHRTHGRKVNDLEKSQLDSVYTNYKACKKKLRLLEVFIEKYEKRKMDS